MTRRKNILSSPKEEKFKVYNEIDENYLKGKSVKMEEHKSGFPAITIDCDNVHVITDILSLEEWKRGLPQE